MKYSQARARTPSNRASKSWAGKEPTGFFVCYVSSEICFPCTAGVPRNFFHHPVQRPVERQREDKVAAAVRQVIGDARDPQPVAHASYLFRAGGVNSDSIRVVNPAAEMLS